MTSIQVIQLPFIKRFTATLASIIAFLIGFSVLSYTSWSLLSHTLWTQNSFPDGTPQSFNIVLENTTHSDANHPDFIFIRWHKLKEALPQYPQYKLRLSTLEWRNFVGNQTSSAGTDSASFKVIESLPTYQIIETYYENIVAEWSRYKVEGDHIIPLYYRTDGGPFGFLIIFVLSAWVSLKLARLTHRKALSLKQVQINN